MVATYQCQKLLIVAIQRSYFLSELCWGKAMALYTKSQEWKQGKSEMLRGEGNRIKLKNLRFGRWQVIEFRKERRQGVPKSACSWDE